MTVTQASHPQYTNTPSRTPSTSEPTGSENGSSHPSDGWTEPGSEPLYTLTSAITANSPRIATSRPSNACCTRALSSTPRYATHVISAMKPVAATARASVDRAAASQPTRMNRYLPAISDSVAMTITSAANTAKPLSHPSRGPRARVTQANVVPQSGSTRLSAR